MRFHYDTSLSPGATPVASVLPCGAIRTGLGLPVIAFTRDGNHISALARRGMR
jgi:hypothetical protein